MKIGIVIPLKSRMVSNDWSATVNNLRATLASVNNQSSKSFSCVVVCHEAPNISSFENIAIEKDIQIPVPKLGQNPSINQLLYEEDRCKKILFGIFILKKKHDDITHWFALDADDLLHQDFIWSVESKLEYDAIVIKKGYIFYSDKKVFNWENNFDQYCGSSAIIGSDLLGEHEAISKMDFRKTIYGYSGPQSQDRFTPNLS